MHNAMCMHINNETKAQGPDMAWMEETDQLQCIELHDEG